MSQDTLAIKQFLTGLIGACEGAITAPALAGFKHAFTDPWDAYRALSKTLDKLK